MGNSLAYVAHCWAARTLPKGHSTIRRVDYYGDPCEPRSALFFDGPRLWSHGHHYLMAQIIEHDGQPIALLNDRGYPGYNRSGRETADTPSTINHRNIARRAAERAGLQVIEVWDAELDHAGHRRRKLDEVREAAADALRARLPERFVTRLRVALGHIAEWEDYKHAFGLPPEPFSLPEDLRTKIAGRAVRFMMRDDNPQRIRTTVENLLAIREV